MRLPIVFLLFAVLCAPAFADVPSCVLKVRILAPSEGFFAPVVANGTTNLQFEVNVTNASSRTPVDAQVTLVLDNGTELDVPKVSDGNYSLAIADYREGTHGYTVNASQTGCISDEATQYYYYRKSVLRSAPDFNPLLAPFVALALLAVARTQKKKTAKKNGKTRV